MGLSHIGGGGYLFWEGCVDSGRVTYSCLKGAYLEKGG